MFHVGIELNQQASNFETSLKTGQSESRVLVRLNLCIYVRAFKFFKLKLKKNGTFLKQYTCGLHVPIHCGQHQRGNAQLGVRARVDFGAVFEQQLDNVHITTGCSQRKRGVVAQVAMFLIGIVFQQQFHNILSAATACHRQGGVLGSVRLRVHLGTGRDEKIANFGMASGGGKDQRGETLLVAMLNLGTLADQHIGQCGVATDAGER